MKITHLACGLALAAALAPTMARAGSDLTGTTAASFLTLGTDPAMLARGGATLGIVSGIGATPWNPAALGFMKETQISLSHATFIDSHTQDYLAAGGRFGGSMLHWAVSGLYESEGTFAGRDANNISTGDFNVGSFAGGAHLAIPVGGLAAVGVGGKWVNQTLGSATRGAGFTFDLGVQAHAGPVGFGAAAQNAFGTMRFGSQTYDFPTNYGVGVAVEPPGTGLRIALDANFPKAYYEDVRGGVEWRWHDMVALRAGYRKELGAPEGDMLSGPTFGMGAGVYGMWLDYGYVVPATGDPEHRIGITLRPGHMNLGALGHSASAAPAATNTTQAPNRHPIHATAAPAASATGTTANPTTAAGNATPPQGGAAGTAPASAPATSATPSASTTSSASTQAAIPSATKGEAPVTASAPARAMPNAAASTTHPATPATRTNAAPAGSMARSGNAAATRSGNVAARSGNVAAPRPAKTAAATTAAAATAPADSGAARTPHHAANKPANGASAQSAGAAHDSTTAAAQPVHPRKKTTKKQRIDAQSASTGQQPDPFQDVIERAKAATPDAKDRLKK